MTGYKQFRHYLLGRRFQLLTDHASLQWLSAQKMKGMLCRWALAMQEFDFQIVYRKGSLNTNADALSRLPCAATVAMPHYSIIDLRAAQQHNGTIAKVYRARLQSSTPPRSQGWNRHPLQRYRQLWAQLQIVDGVLCRHYTPSPMAEAVTVPILPTSLHQDALQRNHDAPTAGHQGTLERLRREGYWVSQVVCSCKQSSRKETSV